MELYQWIGKTLDLLDCFDSEDVPKAFLKKCARLQISFIGQVWGNSYYPHPVSDFEIGRGHLSPANLPMPRIFILAMLPYCFIMRRMSAYWRRTSLTSCTLVPLPRAMRLRRFPSIRL